MTTEFDLENDLPEYKTKIENLKKQNNHFAKISDNYNEVNRKISKMEKGGHFTDEELENLRKRRLQIKDEIIGMLEKAA